MPFELGEQRALLRLHALGLLGFGSKVVVTGDVTQIDLPEGRGRSGLLAVRDILQGIDGVQFVELDRGDVVRHRIVQDIVHAYERASEPS